MKNFCLITILIFLSHFAYSQVTLFGKVSDAESGSVLEFTNIAILDKGEGKVITGGMTDLDGSFEIPNVPSGSYTLRVSFVGYVDYTQDITVEEGQNRLRIGNIKLVPDTETLDEIRVEAAAILMENEIDKRVFNVENSIIAEGGNAIDLLATLPSVQVDEEGGISMRGSGSILIYINGRPTNMVGDDTESILEQFPANSIQKIELITNPSARYDAEGIGGIINIVLKKNQKQGLNGSVNGGIGLRTVNEFIPNQYNFGTNLNYRSGAWNIYGGYNYQYRQMFMVSESLRENLRQPLNTSRYLDQDFYTEAYNHSHLIRGGFDYQINDKMTLGLSAQSNLRLRDRERTYNIRSMNEIAAYNAVSPSEDFIAALDSMYIRDLTEDVSRENYEVALTYDYEIDTLGQKLYSSFSFARDTQARSELFQQDFRDSNFESDPSKYVDQILRRPRENDFFIAQIDYEKPLRTNAKLELGLKSTLRREKRYQEFEESFGEPGSTNRQYVLNEQVSGAFAFNEDVHAGYAIYKDKFGKFGMQAGLRAEYTSIELFDPTDNSKLTNPLTGVEYEDQTPYFNFFPSLYLTYTFRERQDLQLNYSRRIRRPGAWTFNPFLNVQDPLNQRIGNPNLLPELTDSYELAYFYEGEKLLFTGTTYFRRTTDVLTRIFELGEGNVSYMRWENVAIRNTTGLELVKQYSFSRNMDFTLTSNFFNTEIKAPNLGDNFNNSRFSYSFNLMSNIVIPDILSFQIQGNYRGPIVLPQGEIRPFWGLNVGAKRDFWDKKATVSVNFSDIFNTRIFRIDTFQENAFDQQRLFNRETRIINFTFTYRFKGFMDKRNGRDERDEEMEREMF